jgi:Icc-related predicted phosphoesterase
MGFLTKPRPSHGRRAATDRATCSLYYASDVHGSDQCWRKFLGAGRHYGVEALVMGGDLTGKAIVPITRDGAAFSATFLGEQVGGTSPEALEQLVEAIRHNGMYPWIASADEIARHARDDRARDVLLEQVLLDELRRWIALADERMAAYDIDVFVMAGNDDPWAVDAILEDARHVQACDDRVVRVGRHEMISLSYANRTPWSSPRELDESDLYERIARLARQLDDPQRAIFNLHVPPYDTGLDRAIEIDPENLTPVYVAGHPNEISVGSRAVREAIEEFQPAVSLHGHIHESRAEARIGRTLAVNSGSEYNSGQLHGVLITLQEERVVAHQFVVG